ncbi:MAG: hypothetical protein JWM86_499 [Thermoleophilia bacterium]|nr:hypothetical protein [Thermoleophilia bacterium]
MTREADSHGRGPSRRAATRARRVSAIAFVILVLTAGVALAWNTLNQTNPGTSVTAASLGTPGSFTVATTNSCLTTTLTWTAAANANSYLVEVRTANGSFATVPGGSSIGNVTTFTDTVNRSGTNRSYTYQLTPMVSGSVWTGTSATFKIVCGIGEVSDLAATNGCTNTPVTLTWSAAGGTATQYDIWRSINGAAPLSAAPNIAALTWNDTTRVVGQSVTYYVIPNNAGGTDGNISNTTAALDVGFFIKSITYGNGGVAGSVDNLDTVDVRFSKTTNGTLPGGVAANSVYINKTGGTHGVWFASSGGSVATTGIAGHIANANLTGTGASGVHLGAASFPTPDVWHWERGSAAASAFAAPAWAASAVTVGSLSPVRCNNGTTGLTATDPTESSWF